MSVLVAKSMPPVMPSDQNGLRCDGLEYFGKVSVRLARARKNGALEGRFSTRQSLDSQLRGHAVC